MNTKRGLGRSKAPAAGQIALGEARTRLVDAFDDFKAARRAHGAGDVKVAAALLHKAQVAAYAARQILEGAAEVAAQLERLVERAQGEVVGLPPRLVPVLAPGGRIVLEDADGEVVAVEREVSERFAAFGTT